MLQDIRFALRILMKRPSFTIIAVLTLALGIGANSAIFSVVNTVFLKLLPYDEPERLVVLRGQNPITKNTLSVSYPDYLDWRDQNTTFERMAAVGGADLILNTNDGAEPIRGKLVSAEYFQVLGLKAATGRVFLSEENQTPDSHPVVVVGHRLWQLRYGSDPTLVGRNIRIDGVPFTVVGIMPEGFRGFAGGADMWVPMMMHDTINPSLRQYDIVGARHIRWPRVIGRIKPTVNLEQAEANLDAVARQLEDLYPLSNQDKGILLTTAHDELVGSFESPLFLLFGAVGFVLLIACANVANLLLAKSAYRRREIAIRLAVGARQGQLVRQFLTESVMLALAGGIGALLIAVWGLDTILAFMPFNMPGFAQIEIDMTVLGFTGAIALLTGLLFGIGPALTHSQLSMNATLKDSTARTGIGQQGKRMNNMLVVTEIALACILLIGAGLMMMSFSRMQTFDPGFKTDHLLTARIGIPNQYGTDREKALLAGRILEETSQLPGVSSASLLSHLFYDGGYMRNTMTPDNAQVVVPDEGDMSYRQFVGPDYMKTMGIPLIQGRGFTIRDDERTPDIVIVSESLARKYWGNDDPIGKRLKFTRAAGPNDWYEIVGVVKDVKPKMTVLNTQTLPQAYTPLLQVPVGGTSYLTIRTVNDPQSIINTLQQKIRGINPMIRVFQVRTMEQLMAGHTTTTRFIALLMGVFSVVALILAMAGIYGVMSYAVSQRTREIGIRLALGAHARDVILMVFNQGIRLTLAGIIIGLTGAGILAQWLASQLFDVSATDPFIFGGAAILLTMIALLACYIPARRTLLVDPIITLREE